jgi:serine/threonine protein kinase
MDFEFLTSDLAQWVIHNTTDEYAESGNSADYDLFLAEITATINSILVAAGEPPNSEPRRLGYGNFAEVYWLKDKKRVLKLTTDVSDANASELVRRKPDRSLVKVYDVFQVPESRLFGIIAEKLVNLTGSERSHWDVVGDTLEEERRLQPFQMSLVWYERKLLPFLEWVKVARSSLAKHFDAATVETLRRWCEVLTTRHIVWQDMHPGNIRFRGRTPVLMDLGSSKVPSQRIPVLPVDYPED